MEIIKKIPGVVSHKWIIKIYSYHTHTLD